jgi:hypothetical protein
MTPALVERTCRFSFGQPRSIRKSLGFLHQCAAERALAMALRDRKVVHPAAMAVEADHRARDDFVAQRADEKSSGCSVSLRAMSLRGSFHGRVSPHSCHNATIAASSPGSNARILIGRVARRS